MMNRFELRLLLAVAILISAIGCSNERAAIDVTESNHDELVSAGKPVVLDFGAKWCSPCVRLSPTIESVAFEYEGQVVVGKVDVDESVSLAKKYDIEVLPTLCYIKDGKVVAKQTHGISLSSIRTQIDAMLESD